MTDAEIVDEWLMARAEVDYRLEVLRQLIDQLPEEHT